MSDLSFTRPDPCSIRAATRQVELADAVRGWLSADGYPLAGGDPLAPMARDATCALMAAGFMLHHHDRYHALHRIHGVCLVPVPAKSGTHAARARSPRPPVTCCSIGTGATCNRTCQLVSATPGSVLHAFGYLDRQRDTAGPRFVADHRGERTEAGR